MGMLVDAADYTLASWDAVAGAKMAKSPSTIEILEESIIFATIGLILLIGRLWSRAILRQSWKKLQIDDYTMIATFCCYITLLTLLNLSCHFATNEYLPSELPGILADPDEVENRIYGSKIVVGSNQAYLMTLWGVKACLLMLYYHMTKDTPNKFYVKLCIVYTMVGLLAIEIPYFFILCRPFTQYWALPVDNPQCANYLYYCIIQMAFNISSDFLMLLIPLPLIIHAKVPPLKRALLFAIFSLGIFVILAAVLNKYYNFTAPGTTVYMIWHIREASTSIYVANMMCCWPLVRKIFGLKKYVLRPNSWVKVDGPEQRRSGVGSPGHTPLREVRSRDPYADYEHSDSGEFTPISTPSKTASRMERFEKDTGGLASPVDSPMRRPIIQDLHLEREHGSVSVSALNVDIEACDVYEPVEHALR